MIVNKNGWASVQQIIKFCPLDELRLKTINIAWYSDGIVYGGVPELPFAGFPGRVVSHDQVNFPINVAGPAN